MRTIALLLAVAFFAPHSAAASESIWIEAEHLRGIRGSCFPDMGGNTKGHWATSGPGIAPEWTQGGESGWMSIACGPDDDQASAHLDVESPEAGDWTFWVRYRDWRRQTEIFAVRIEQAGKTQEFVFGKTASKDVDEEDELKILWNWAFAWDSRTVKLEKGPFKLTLLSHAKQKGHRQIDCFCLTTDARYHPVHRERPASQTWKALDELRKERATLGRHDAAIPESWKPTKIKGKDFVYLWNVGKAWEEDLASTDAGRMLYPFHVEPNLVAEFRKTFGGKKEVPIFSDPRIAPAFHSAGPNHLDNPHFVKWLDANPDRLWGNMMNYIDAKPMSAQAKANWPKYRDRYVGNISGESLGHGVPSDTKALHARIAKAKTRTDLFAAFSEIFQSGVAVKQKAIHGEPGTSPYEHYIPCQAVEMTTFAHACREWGARVVGYESAAVIPSLGMRLAFLRGSARQYGGSWTTYRSCNLGDSATIYSEQGSYAHPKYVYDNWYDAWSGAGMTWYKFDLWQQYMAGSNVFYHEQGFDEFWTPAGGSTPKKPLQLSPKGRLVDHFLETTRRHPERGIPYTPIAFLLDQAHGWEPNPYSPSAFSFDLALNPELLHHGKHERMLLEWFQTAYHPYGPAASELNTGVNQNYIPGAFGNIFDVLVTSPTKRDALSAYPVVILNGEVTISEAWGKALADYMQHGGTVVACDEHLSGPGVAALMLPKLGPVAEDLSIQWLPLKKSIDSQRFRYRPIEGGEPLAKAGKDDTIAAEFPRGKGRLVFLSIPRGVGIDGAATPLVARTLAYVRQGLMPIEVEGDVEWLLNKTAKGWIVTMLNPAGVHRVQHGVSVTDYKQRRTVVIHLPKSITQAGEWMTDETPQVNANTVRVTIPAGAVRVVELK